MGLKTSRRFKPYNVGKKSRKKLQKMRGYIEEMREFYKLPFYKQIWLVINGKKPKYI